MIKQLMLLMVLNVFGTITLFAQSRQTHTVAAGETLYSISRTLNVTVTELKAWNDLSDNALSVGQTLIYFQQDEEQLKDLPEAESLVSISTPQENVFYIVKSGDNLTTIAREHSMSLNELRELNNLSSDLLRIGQQLTVRKVKDSVAPSAREYSEQSTPQGTFAIYTVKNGEDAEEILQRFEMSEFELQELNPEINVSSLNTDQRITVLIPPTGNYENPYTAKANLQDLGTVAAFSYALEEAGNPTTNGELHNPQSLTAAHSNIAIGSILFVENPETGAGIFVRINDRITRSGLKLSAEAYRILGLQNSSNPLIVMYSQR